MFHLFDYLAKFAILSGKTTRCDDFVDRLNRKYTICFLLLCCAIISSKQYVGDPLSCFCPSHFTGAHVEYTNNICWISNAFYVPLDEAFSPNSELQSNVLDDTPNSQIKVIRVNNLIAYYPFILLAQAILFYIPYFLWKNIVNRSAYDISTLVNFANETIASESTDYKEKGLRYLIRHIDRASKYYSGKGSPSPISYTPEFDEKLSDSEENVSKYQAKSPRSSTKRKVNFESANNSDNEENSKNPTRKEIYSKKSFNNNNESSYGLPTKLRKNTLFSFLSSAIREKFLFTTYLIIKLFYFLNCFGQLLLLNKLITGDKKSVEPTRHDSYFLMRSNSVWIGFEFGYKSIISLIQTGSLFGGQDSKLLIFHSVIFCDFKIRVLGDRLHKHTVQCVVPINIFSEKLFTLLWFWLLILSFINLYNFLIWFKFYLFTNVRSNFLKNYLLKKDMQSASTTLQSAGSTSTTATATKLNESSSTISKETSNKPTTTTTSTIINYQINNANKKLINLIINKYLELDNLFVIRMISKNTNEILTQELIAIMVDYYQTKNSLYYYEKKSVNL